MFRKVGSEDYHTAALPAQRCFSAMITTSLEVKSFPAGAWYNCAAGLGEWRKDVGMGMGMSGRVFFLFTADMMLWTYLMDGSRLYEDAPWFSPGGCKQQVAHGRRPLLQGRPDPMLLSESSESARGPVQGLLHGESVCHLESGWNSHP